MRPPNSVIVWMDMASFPERLKQLRNERQLTQVRLAELLDVNPRVYNRWENGEATPHLDTVVHIADILSVTLDELTGRQDVKPESQIHNHELHRLYQRVNELSDEDQQALLVVLDSLLKRSTMRQIMAD